jgi:hypothetical protein
LIEDALYHGEYREGVFYRDSIENVFSIEDVFSTEHFIMENIERECVGAKQGERRTENLRYTLT